MSARTVRTVLVNTLLLVLSPLLLFGLLEWALATFWPQLPRFSGLFSRADERVGAYMARPDAVATEFSPEFGEIEIRTNAQGLRDHRDYGTKPPDVFRILALGDSFTWGYGVAYEGTFLRLLERRLEPRVEIVKAGVPGFGTREEDRLLQAYGLSVDPDLVLLTFIGEDMLNNGTPNGFNQIRHERTLWNVFRARSVEQLEYQLRHASHLYNLLMSVANRGPALRWFAEQKAADSFMLRDYPPAWTRLWTATEGHLDDMRARLAARGIPLAIVVMPQRIQIMVETLGMDTAALEPDKPARLVREWAAAHGVPVLDLYPRFRDEARVRELYFPIDGHLNADGTAIVAEELEPFVRALPAVARRGGRSQPEPTG